MTHNGGRIQLCPSSLQTGMEFPFMNHLATGQQWFQSTDGQHPTPINLDPNTNLPVSGPGIATVIYIPVQSDRPGNWIVDWQGNMTSLRHNFGATTVSGALSGVNGFWKFTPTDAPDLVFTGALRLDVGIGTYDGANPITQLRVYHEADQTAINVGAIFNTQYISTLQALRPGILRFLDWTSGNTSKVPRWALRRPTTMVTYSDAYMIPSQDCGASGGTSAAVTVTYPGGQTLIDKLVIHFRATNSITSGATLNAIPIKGADGSSSFTQSAGRMCTCVYDADLNVWVSVDGGLSTAVPPEIMVQLCNLVGAHPWLFIPYLACDNTDYVTNLATYCKNNLASGLKPFFECNNEVWNTASGFPGSNYATSKSTVMFPSTNIHDYYAAVCSINAQAVSGVYSNDRTQYEFVCGVQSATFGSVSSSDRRLTSPQWVALGGGRTAASNWVTGVSCTSYINAMLDSSTTGVTNELAAAYIWQTASDATKVTQSAAYWADNTGERTAAAHPLPDTTSLQNSYIQWLAWGVSKGVSSCKLFAYEGGNSQDYPPALSDDNCSITNIVSSGVNTLVTLSATTTHPPVGMWVSFNGILGMTQLNTAQGLITGFNSGTNVLTVAIDSSGFSAWSSGGTQRCRPYLALPITAITKASSAGITVNNTGVGWIPRSGYFCYVVGVSGMVEINGLNAAAGGSNASQRDRTSSVNSFTLGINSTGFSTYTSGGFVLVPSVCLRADFRAYTRTEPRLYDIEYTNMKNFKGVAADASSMPSLFGLASDLGQVWAALKPNIYHNDAQKYDAFRLFSNRKRRLRWVG